MKKLNRQLYNSALRHNNNLHNSRTHCLELLRSLPASPHSLVARVKHNLQPQVAFSELNRPLLLVVVCLELKQNQLKICLARKNHLVLLAKLQHLLAKLHRTKQGQVCLELNLSSHLDSLVDLDNLPLL